MPGGFVPYHHDGPKKGQPYKDPGYTSGGSKSGGTGGGSATYGSPSSPTTSAAAGVQSVASTAATGAKNIAKTGSPAAPAYSATHPTTTIDLRPQISSITDPATRALASSAISSGLKYEVNPSVLLAAASVTDYGRKGQGKGYTNLGDGSEDGAKSIRQAAKYLSEAGFHKDPDGAIKALAKTIGHDPSEIRKTASGYTELDQAARTIEETPGDMRVKGVGRFKYRNPEDRPGVKAMRGANGTVPKRGVTVNGGPDQALNQVERNAMQQGVKNAPGAKAQAAATAAQATADVAAALTGQPTGPNPRKVAKRLTRAAGRATPEVTGLSDPNQATFAAELSKETGLSPRVVAAWVKQEGGNLNPGDNNWLNIGAFDSGFDQGIMGDPRFRDPVSAAKVTADFLRGKEFGASEGIQGILSAAGSSDEQQIQTIANSGWAGDPNYAANISRNYQGVSADPGKDVPKQLVTRANNVLGKEATKAILAGGKLIRDPKAGKGSGPVQVSSAKDQIKAGAIVKATPKQDKYFSYDHSTDRAWFDPVLMQQLVKLAKASGEPIQINSGFRTLDEQKAAYADYQAGGALAATPGSSNHEFGLAADLQLTDKQRSMLGQFGLGLPVSGEDWHVEVTDPALQAKQKAVNLGSSGGSATVTGGDTNIPIPGTNLAVRPPAPTTSGGSSTSYGGTSGTGSPADALGTALNEAAKQQQGGGSLAPGLSIQSAAAAYARKSLQGGDTQDPLYDAFRPSR